MLLRRHQDFLRVREIEVAALAEDVAAFRQFLLGHGRQHLVNDKRHVLFGRAAELFRNGMCTEKRRDKFNRGRFVQLTDNAQNFQLFLERQAVTGLGLHRRGSAAQEPVCSLLRIREKFRFACRAGLAHSRTNPAATGGNLFVGRAARAHLEFIHSIPAEDRMSMRVHETRQHHPALPRRQLRHRSGNWRSISSEVPIAVITPSRTNIPPSSMIARSLSSLPIRGRLGPARVTNCEACKTARAFKARFTACLPPFLARL